MPSPILESVQNTQFHTPVMTGTRPLMIRPRKAVEAIRAYHPPIEGRRAFIRLDFNENTQGYPDQYPEGLPEALLHTYPEYQSFITQAAALWGVPEDHILLVNGSDEGLAVIASTFIEPGVDKALISDPTFALIPHYLRLAEATILQVPVLPGTLAFDLEAMKRHLADPTHPVKLVMLASPDNPTGATVDLDQIAQWCETYPNTLFVMDEAYAEYRDPSLSAVNLLPRFTNLLVTRTFSKAWGLAGLRLGAVLGHPQLMDYMMRVRSPYSVNVMAIEMAQRLLPQKEKVYFDAQAIMRRKQALMAQIEGLGIPVQGAEGNFFMVRMGLEAQALSAFCEQHGVLVRDRSSHPLLKGMVRISVGTDAENEKLLTILKTYKNQQALIFDLDDTLVDTSRSFSQVVHDLIDHYAPEHPLGPNELDALRAEGGFNDDWVATHTLLARRGISVALRDIEAEGSRRYYECAKAVETPLFQWEELHRLSNRYRLFIITGRRRKEYDTIWGEALAPYFEAVYCVDDVEGLRGKPYPDLFQHLKAQYGITQGYYVGNNVDDMEAAEASEMVPIGITTTQPASTLQQAGGRYIIDRISALEELLIQ